MFSNIEKLIPFMAFVVSYAFGSYIFFREPNLSINRLFILIVITPFIDDLVRITYWMRVAQFDFMTDFTDLSLWLLPSLYYHFIACFEERRVSWGEFFRIYSIFAISFATHLAYGGETFRYVYLAGSIAFFAFWFFGQYSRERKAHRSYQKIQQFLIFFGFSVNLLLLSLAQFDTGNEYIDQYQMLSPLVIVTFIGSALLRVRAANIFYIVKKSTVYAFFLFIFVFSYIAAAVYLFNYFQITGDPDSPYYMALLVVIFAIIFRPIVDFIREFIDRNIFRTLFNYKLTVEGFSHKISSVLQLRGVLELVSATLAESFRPAFIYFYRIPNGTGDFQVFYGEKASPPPDLSGLAAFFMAGRRGEVLFVDYLSNETIAEPVYDYLIRSRVCLIFAAFHETELLGLYFMGYKFTKDSYNDDDVQLIATISNQAGVAFSNVRIYDNLVESNRRLEETVSELKNTQIELAKKEKLAALGHLSANIAHEVRNPLGIMKVSASTLSDALADRPKLREVAMFINKEIDKLNNVVTELLEFARDRELKVESVDPASMLSHLAEEGNLYARSEGKKIDFSVSLPAEKVHIMADQNQLSGALLNIVINAVDSIDKGRDGNVRITLCRRSPAKVAIVIADSGAGIDESLLKRVFEPFFTTKKSGTGLGLAVTNQIVEKHGGSVAIRSKAGSGTEAEITLPEV